MKNISMTIAKKKIFIFAYEGTGLGHLMSLIKISSGLYPDYECLVVSGHTALPQIIPSGINFYLIPNFQEELKLGKNEVQVNRERISLLWNLINYYKPDAFITDFLPLGKRLELYSIITKYPCRKYFTLRSEIGGEKVMYNDVFSSRNNYILEDYYHKIFLMSDPRLTEFEIFSKLSKNIQEKIVYTGFVTYKVSNDEVLKTRKEWLNGLSQKWIVCSDGGGRKGEPLLEQCIELSKKNRFKDCQFDIILGYYSSLLNKYPQRINDNVRIINHTKDLYLLHASADFVICTGAYNSLIESLQGKPKTILGMSVLCNEEDDEQIQNILKLQKFFNIYNVSHPKKLCEQLDYLINFGNTNTRHTIINMNGIINIRKEIDTDLINK